MDNEEESRIQRLQRQLYSREYKPQQNKRTDISSKQTEDVQTEWNDTEAQAKKKTIFPKRKEGFYIKWLLVIAVAFFVISFAIAAIIYIRGGANVSSKNVDVRILGPVSVGGGEELSLEVIVDNKNNVDIESANVQIEYPDGTRSPDDLNKEFLRDQKEYGSIAAGSNVRKTFKSVLFGEQDSIKEIKVTVEYRVQGSSATFPKEKVYEIQISSAPVLVNIDYPNQIRSDQEVEFIIDITSNSSTDLYDILLKVDYPFGFSFAKADPAATFDTNIFSIGKLKPEEKRTIKIRGTLQAQDNEERTFRFDIGTENSNNQKELGAIYVSTNKTIAITKPSLGLVATINGSASNELVARSGRNISTVISWFNNLTERVVNADVSASFSGSMAERSSVVAGNGGFYRSADDTVIWNQNLQSSLADISPGKRGSVSFGFDIKTLTSALGANLRNPEIKIDVDIEGTRFSEGNVPEQVQTMISKRIKIASDLDLSARAVHTIGPLENMGPIPPRVDQITTYTVILSLTNSYNDVKNVRVAGQLPSYVEWENTYTPNGENVTFNQTTNQVIWEVQNLPAGTGFSSSPKEIAFRVKMIPSLSQVRSSPVIIQNLSAEGNDNFAGINISDTAQPLTTVLLTDPGVLEDGGTVLN